MKSQAMRRSLLRTLLCLCLAAILMLCMGCSAGKKLVGSWEMLNEEGKDSGVVLTFFEDGTYKYGTDWRVETDSQTYEKLMDTELMRSISSILDNVRASDAGAVLESLSELVTLKYEAKNSNEIIIKTELIFGLVSKTTTVKYSLKGDTLTFDGINYRRCDELD